jgi:hypothetical protein
MTHVNAFLPPSVVRRGPGPGGIPNWLHQANIDEWEPRFGDDDEAYGIIEHIRATGSLHSEFSPHRSSEGYVYHQPSYAPPVDKNAREREASYQACLQRRKAMLDEINKIRARTLADKERRIELRKQQLADLATTVAEQRRLDTEYIELQKQRADEQRRRDREWNEAATQAERAAANRQATDERRRLREQQEALRRADEARRTAEILARQREHQWQLQKTGADADPLCNPIELRQLAVRYQAAWFPHVTTEILNIVEWECSDAAWLKEISEARNNMPYDEILWKRTRFLAGYK